MPPIYRGEQNRFSFHGEAGPGGYLDYISAIDDSGGAATTLSVAATAGSRSITVASAAGYVADDYVQIGTTANGNAEVRRVASVSGSVIYLDTPLGFPHAAADTVDEKLASGIAGSSFATFLPGVYDRVGVPDPVMEIRPHWFLGTSSNRNFFRAYRGRQHFSGSLPGVLLLNGFPLRFPLGRVTTVASAVTANTTTLSAAASKGARVLSLTAAGGFTNGSFLEVERGGAAPEVRQVISGGGTTTIILNYPLMIAHANGVTVTEVNTTGVSYTHTIAETTDLDSMTWHVLQRDSDETAANDFIRRYIGGKVNRATIFAEEGGLLQMSLDEVVFLDMIHNQTAHSAASMIKESAALIAPSGVGGGMAHSGGALGSPVTIDTQPYYFSQGSISFFGTTFARIRNFRLDISNNVDPRYYITNSVPDRVPAELQEQRREYRMSAIVALPDSLAATATTRTLFKELLLEGNYTAGFTGFDISLTFTRGTNDSITITIPPSAAAVGGDAQGAFIVRAPTQVGPESPIQTSVDMIFRSLRISVVDAVGVYP